MSATTQQGNSIHGAHATAGANQFVGNNFSAGGNNIINLYNTEDSEAAAKKKCLRALFVSSPADDRAKHLSFKGQVISATCQWLTETEVYRSWLDAQSRVNLLWLCGGPGVGKTMLSVYITQQLEKYRAESLVLYYFCEGRDPKRNSPIQILRGLIYSLVQQRPALIEHLLPDYEVQGDVLFAPEAIESLWRILMKMIGDRQVDCVFCLVDGMDECAATSTSQLEHLLAKFQALSMVEDAAPTQSAREVLKTPKSKFKLALICREQPEVIPQRLSRFTRIQIGKPVDRDSRRSDTEQPQPVNAQAAGGSAVATGVAASASDLSPQKEVDSGNQLILRRPIATNDLSQPLHIYIEEKVRALSAFKGHDRKVQVYLEESLKKRGDGTFIWVDMAIEQLRKSAIHEKTENTFASLPDGLEGMYCLTLLQVCPEHRHLVSLVLGWITVALRPMTIKELTELVCMTVNQPKGKTKDEVGAEIKQAVEACGNLVSMSVGDEVKLGHQTAKDFLTSPSSPILANARLHQFSVSEADRHAELAQLSFRYLETSVFTERRIHLVSIPAESPEDEGIAIDTAGIEKQPFLPYATFYWTDHVKQAGRGKVNFNVPFFENKDRTVRRNWWRCAWEMRYLRDSVGATAKMSILHVAAFFDLIELAEYMSAKPDFQDRINKHTGELKKPIEIAVEQGSVKVFEFLLDCGARTGSSFGNVLETAAKAGQTAIVQILLDRGYAFDVIEDAIIPRTGAELLFLPVAVALKGALFFTPRKVKDKLIKLSNEKDSDYSLSELQVEEDFDMNLSTLHTALCCGHEAIAKALLAKGASVDKTTRKGWTAVHFSAWSGDERLLALVHSYGADLDAKTNDGRTAMHIAAWRGRVEAVEYLLKQGKPVDVATSQLETLLHLAAVQDHTELVRTLLSAWGADIEARTSKGFTPLHVAAKAGKAHTVKVLLEHGANREALTASGETPLKLAHRDGHNEVVVILRNYRLQSAPGVSTPASPPQSLHQPTSLQSAPAVSSPQFFYQPTPQSGPGISTPNSPPQSLHQSTPSQSVPGLYTPAPPFQTPYQSTENHATPVIPTSASTPQPLYQPMPQSEPPVSSPQTIYQPHMPQTAPGIPTSASTPQTQYQPMPQSEPPVSSPQTICQPHMPQSAPGITTPTLSPQFLYQPSPQSTPAVSAPSPYHPLMQNYYNERGLHGQSPPQAYQYASPSQTPQGYFPSPMSPHTAFNSGQIQPSHVQHGQQQGPSLHGNLQILSLNDVPPPSHYSYSPEQYAHSQDSSPYNHYHPASFNIPPPPPRPPPSYTYSSPEQYYAHGQGGASMHSYPQPPHAPPSPHYTYATPEQYPHDPAQNSYLQPTTTLGSPPPLPPRSSSATPSEGGHPPPPLPQRSYIAFPEPSQYM